MAEKSRKNEIMKMLLSAPNPPPQVCFMFWIIYISYLFFYSCCTSLLILCLFVYYCIRLTFVLNWCLLYVCVYDFIILKYILTKICLQNSSKARMDKTKSSDNDGEYGIKLSNYLQQMTGQVYYNLYLFFLN